MQDSSRYMSGALPRRLVLASAFALGLIAAFAPHTDIVRAADFESPPVIAQGDTKGAAKAAAPTAGASAKDAKSSGAAAPPKASTPAGKGATEEAPDADVADENADDEESAKDKGTVTIGKGSKHIRIEGIGRDREYDSFEQFVQDAPWLAGLVFLVVLLVFLVPLLILVLLIWYKMRKNRLANETMLKLAERGVVPTAAAMEAVASGATPESAAVSAAPAGTPAYDQARLIHRKTVWSDLRKGVILSGAGLGLSAFSMFDDGTPNSVGLVLLFVGLGYCLLWYFEDRKAPARRDTPGAPPGAA